LVSSRKRTVEAISLPTPEKGRGTNLLSAFKILGKNSGRLVEVCKQRIRVKSSERHGKVASFQKSHPRRQGRGKKKKNGT